MEKDDQDKILTDFYELKDKDGLDSTDALKRVIEKYQKDFDVTHIVNTVLVTLI